MFAGLLQSHGNVVKWMKKEGDKVGYCYFWLSKFYSTSMVLSKNDHYRRKTIN